MKKSAYITPDIKVRQIEPTAIMAASGEEQNISIDVEGGEYSGAFNSKQHSSTLWDDEDE